MNVSEPVRQLGRPRCEAAKTAILSAARRLFETSNLRDLTIEAISKEAGVSKATIYRWWNTKADLVMDACLEDLRRYTAYDLSEGDPVTVITNQMRRLIKVYSGPVGRMVCQLVAEGQYEPEICQRFFDTHAGERCPIIHQMLGGEREDLLFLTETLYGPIYFRLLRGRWKLDDEFADRVTAEAAKRIRAWKP